jgi:hypothetical protein
MKRRLLELGESRADFVLCVSACWRRGRQVDIPSARGSEKVVVARAGTVTSGWRTNGLETS